MRSPKAPGAAVRTLGCKVNQVESETFVADLLARGFVLADPDEAHVIVVNSCCVTGEAERKVRKAVRGALRARSSPAVLVTGCLTSIDPEGLASVDERLVVEPDREAVARRAAESVGLTGDATARVVRAGPGFRTRAMVKVEDGCDAFCAYCIVPHARGAPRSVPFVRVLDEVGDLVGAGIREVVLTGVNLGRYDSDGHDLTDLVRAVADTGVERLRLSSIEPPDLDERLLSALAEAPAVCRHLHVPLQSGSDDVLSRMGRCYDSAAYLETVERAAALLPGLAVTTDVIAGFPGETAADAAATVALLESLAGTVSKLHVFRFSPRPGTRAADIRPRVDSETLDARAAALRELGDSLRARYVGGRLGRSAEVLMERVEGASGEGTSRDYLKVRVDRDGLVPGSVEHVVLTGTDGSRVTAA